MKLALQDVLIDHKRIIISEWINTCDHFINQNTQSPPINRLTMSLILENLRGKILWSSTESKGSILYLFCEAKIG
jgi:hypothetical protein